jgi:hypothetical protein
MANNGVEVFHPDTARKEVINMLRNNNYEPPQKIWKLIL